MISRKHLPTFITALFFGAALLSSAFTVVLMAAPRLPDAPIVTTNGIPAPAYSENQNAYLFGSIMGGKIFERDGRTYTNLIVRPFHTPMLYTESVTFCGDQFDSLSKLGAFPVILVYSRRQHRRDCNDFYGVAEVKP